MMASIGAGIYAAPNDIAWRSILVNGGVVFVYRLQKGWMSVSEQDLPLRLAYRL